ncbi:MAG: hypothetical protein CMH22_06130 [Methylophaga sp.]|nr:hypothetical protein [Methylophaga sp.]|tara:strand:+ start:48550 stop:48744 length:195 start_codon:yes stop_codon:yes gene_type:complete
MVIKDPKFTKYQKVFHITPESEVGIVLRATYSASDEKWGYMIGLGFDREVFCDEDELTTEKTVV